MSLSPSSLYSAIRNELVHYPHMMKQGKRGNHPVTSVNPILVAAPSPEGTRYSVKGCYPGAALAWLSVTLRPSPFPRYVQHSVKSFSPLFPRAVPYLVRVRGMRHALLALLRKLLTGTAGDCCCCCCCCCDVLLSI